MTSPPSPEHIPPGWQVNFWERKFILIFIAETTLEKCT
jgi:hypothetical protein